MNKSQWQAIEEIFGQALEQKTSDRSLFIQHTCKHNPSLLAASREMLQAHRDAENFLEQPVFSDLPQKADSPRSMPENIGPFKIRTCLGEGGMGTVYQASENSKQEVALKIVRAGLEDPEMGMRLTAESDILSKLNHPNVIRFIESGRTRQDHPYFTMEYFEGQTLTDFCKQRKLSLRRRLALFLQVCQGVGHAHDRGVIHRDLKPSNLLAGEKNGQMIAKVIDFGIAGIFGEHADVSSNHRVVGTPAYMSPEQAAAGNLDIRSDIYSLGAVLYQMLTDEPPFEPTSINESPWHEVATMIRERDPELPSQRVGAADTTGQGQMRACQLRGDLDRIVMRALQKKRANRYSRVLDLVADIQAFITKRSTRPSRARARWASWRTFAFSVLPQPSRTRRTWPRQWRSNVIQRMAASETLTRLTQNWGQEPEVAPQLHRRRTPLPPIVLRQPVLMRHGKRGGMADGR